MQEGDEHLFQHEFCKPINAIEVSFLKNILISSHGIVVSKKGRSFPMNFIRPTIIHYLPGVQFLWLKLKIVLLEKQKVLNNTTLFVIEPGNSGYFHWITETLPRLIATGNEYKKNPIVLPHLYKGYQFIEESLRLLGFTVYYLPEKDFSFLKESIFISHFATAGNYNDYFIQKTRSILTTGQDTSQPTKRIYISRTKAGRRKIANEEEILPLLQSLRFEIVYCEDMSLSEQIHLFSQAAILVSNHGAGLTNMLFMHTGAAVLELRYDGDRHNNCYFSLASALQIKYYYLKCSPLNDKLDPHISDLFVDKEKLEIILTNTLAISGSKENFSINSQ